MLSDKRRSEFADLLSLTQSKLDQSELVNLTLLTNMSYEQLQHQVVLEHLAVLISTIKDKGDVKLVEDKM